MFQIPTDTGVPFWTQITTLDGTDYLLRFRYNEREACYYLQIQLPDLTVLAQGIKLVSNFRLLQSYPDPRIPRGELYCMATGNDDSPAAFGELGIGRRVELTYQSQAEMRAANQDAWRL